MGKSLKDGVSSAVIDGGSISKRRMWRDSQL
jgi:hypothetical protein